MRGRTFHNMVMFLLTTVLMTPMLLGAFVVQQQHHITNHHHRHHASGGSSIGDLLGDLPTPSLLLELSLAGNSMKSANTSLDDILSKPSSSITTTTSQLLDGAVFVHTKVTDTSVRDEITSQQGSGTSHVIAQVDASFLPGGAYLGIGLANHHVGGYYWARGMGIGASLPAHGIAVRPFGSTTSSSSSELYWRKRGAGVDATETTEESSNSNDGKRSEWADFLVVGDTVQLVPHDINQVLFNSTSTTFTTLLGVRRIGRPQGADPIVEKIWIRDENSNGWVLQPQS